MKLPTITKRRQLTSLAITPQALAWDGKLLWLSSRDLGTLYKIDVEKWKVVDEIDPPGIVWAAVAIRKGAVIAFGIALVIVQIGDTDVPRMPLTDNATVTGVWVFYTLFVLVAFAVEKIGSRGKINAPW